MGLLWTCGAFLDKSKVVPHAQHSCIPGGSEKSAAIYDTKQRLKFTETTASLRLTVFKLSWRHVGRLGALRLLFGWISWIRGKDRVESGEAGYLRSP